MRQPTPRAWACFADTGNCIIWSTDEATVRSIADKHGRRVTPLFDLTSAQIATLYGAALPRVSDFVTHEWPGEWTHKAPQVADHPPGAELVWAVRGHPFTRPILARTNVGARVPGFAAKAEKFVYVELMAEGFHGTHAGRYVFFDSLEWMGPLVLPNAIYTANPAV